MESARPPEKCVQRRKSECVGRRSATAGRTPMQNALVVRSGRLNSHRLTRHSLVVSGGRCELVNWVLYEFVTDPKLLHTITDPNPVHGLAVLDKKLYVLRKLQADQV